MNNDVRNKINSYRRGLEDSKVKSGIYTFLFIVTVFVYGIFGTYSLSRVLKAKLETIKELDGLNANLQIKYSNLLDAQQDLLSASAHIKELYKSVPQKNELEDYMIAVVNAGASSGFKQTSFVIQDTKDGYSDLRLGFEGSLVQVPPLISSLEDLERLTVVRSIDLKQHEGILKVIIILRVFYLTE